MKLSQDHAAKSGSGESQLPEGLRAYHSTQPFCDSRSSFCSVLTMPSCLQHHQHSAVGSGDSACTGQQQMVPAISGKLQQPKVDAPLDVR